MGAGWLDSGRAHFSFGRTFEASVGSPVHWCPTVGTRRMFFTGPSAHSVGRGLGMAVGAQETDVFDSVIQTVPVDVIQVKGDRFSEPLSGHLTFRIAALVRNQSRFDDPGFQVPMRATVVHQQIGQRLRWGPRVGFAFEVGLSSEVGKIDPQPPSPIMEKLVRPTRLSQPQFVQRLPNRVTVPDDFDESGIRVSWLVHVHLHRKVGIANIACFPFLQMWRNWQPRRLEVSVTERS